MSDSAIIDNGQHGILADTSTGGAYTATLERSRVENNGQVGIFLSENGTPNNRATIRNSVASGNQAGILVQANGFGTLTAMIDRVVMVDNSDVGLRMGDPTGTARMGDSTISGNAIGIDTAGGDGQVLSYGNNDVVGNAANGNPSGPVALK
jgi:hypothetical protein